MITRKRIVPTIVQSVARIGATKTLCATWAFTHKRIQPSFYSVAICPLLTRLQVGQLVLA